MKLLEFFGEGLSAVLMCGKPGIFLPALFWEIAKTFQLQLSKKKNPKKTPEGDSWLGRLQPEWLKFGSSYQDLKTGSCNRKR